MWIYTGYAELLCVPLVLITESPIPTLATAVAVEFCSGKPIALSPSLIMLVNGATFILKPEGAIFGAMNYHVLLIATTESWSSNVYIYSLSWLDLPKCNSE